MNGIDYDPYGDEFDDEDDDEYGLMEMDTYKAEEEDEEFESLFDASDDKEDLDDDEPVLEKQEEVFVPKAVNNDTDQTAVARKKRKLASNAPSLLSKTTRRPKRRRKKKTEYTPQMQRLIRSLTKLKTARTQELKERERRNAPQGGQRAQVAQTIERIDDIMCDMPVDSKSKRWKHKEAEAKLQDPPDPIPDFAGSLGYDENELEDRVDDERLKTDPEAKRLEMFEVSHTSRTRKHRYSPYLLHSDFFQKGCGDFYEKKTTYCCYWCTEPCNCVPVGLPMLIQHTGGNNTGRVVSRDEMREVFHVSGVYCSLNCMLAHGRELKVPNHYIYRFMRVVYDVSYKDDITPAPPRFVLKKFGGQYTIEQYRATSRLGIKTKEVRAPLFPSQAGIEEVADVTVTVSEKHGDIDSVIGRVVTMVPKRDAFSINAMPETVITWDDFDICPNMPVYRQDKGSKGKKKRAKPKASNQPAKVLSIDEQLEDAKQRYRLEMKSYDVDDKGAAKRHTIKDFMTKRNK
nr:hypothetical protein [Sicyoidochytrium minutum DNA virus]